MKLNKEITQLYLSACFVYLLDFYFEIAKSMENFDRFDFRKKISLGDFTFPFVLITFLIIGVLIQRFSILKKIGRYIAGIGLVWGAGWLLVFFINIFCQLVYFSLGVCLINELLKYISPKISNISSRFMDKYFLD